MKVSFLQEIEKEFNNLEFAKKEETTFRHHFDNRTEILSFNFYPENVDDTFNSMNRLLEKVIPFRDGEIIVHYAENSRILDQKHEAFLIKKSKIFEIYLYELEAFSYIRLLHEKAPKGNEWISLDIDYIKNCLWFKD